MHKSGTLLALVILLLTVTACRNEKPPADTRIVIGISSDIESLNPMYAISTVEGNIAELTNMSLFRFRWDEETGDLKLFPMLAESWSWNAEKTEISVSLRKDVRWSDGTPVTSDDVIFSYDVYSDPVTESVRLGFFQNFYSDSEDRIDLNKTFETESPYDLKVKFPPEVSPTFYDLDLTIIPKHIFESIERSEIFSFDAGGNYVTGGPYKIAEWKRNEYLKLSRDDDNYLIGDNSVGEIIFKIVPDYTSRLNQLRKGEIDLMEDIKPSDVEELLKRGGIEIVPVEGREYDYIGWNNIDPDIFKAENRIVPNKLFGDARVRKAMTMAINREEVLKEYLRNFGEIASGPVAPIFRNMIDSGKSPYPFDRERAKLLLKEAGWNDSDLNGILDKNGTEFKFTIYIPSGNPRREFAATIFRNNYAEIGIDADVQLVELGAFIDNLYERNMNAWMVGWSVPIPVELKPYWYSDIDDAPLNFAAYRNREVDRLLDLIEGDIEETAKHNYIMKIDSLIHADEPVSFLYWIDNIVGYNDKIKNVRINPLGVIHYCWEWTVE